MPNTARPPRYSPLTRKLSQWLYPLVDRYDWGYWCQRDQCPKFVTTSDMLYVGLGNYPQKLTQTNLQRHLSGHERCYMTPRRASGFCLTMIDVDCHEGQLDGYEAVSFLLARYFPECYWERSARGYHLYPVFRVGRIRRAKFNALLTHLQENLARLFREHGYEATVEVKGSFSLVDEQGRIIDGQRGSLASVPTLPRGEDDLARLLSAPVYLYGTLKAVWDESLVALERELEEAEDAEPSITLDDCVSRRPSPPVKDSACAFERMNVAAFDFTLTHHRLPQLDELLDYYQHRYQTHPATPQRARRARDVLRIRARAFDPEKIKAGGHHP